MDGMAQLLLHLQGCLSVDSGVQKAAEEALRRASALPGYAAALVEVISKEDVDPGVRQLSAVLLKQMVRSHWTAHQTPEGLDPGSGEDPEFSISEREKAAVRKSVIPALLRTQDTKVCTSLSVAISSIANLDWPQHWPSLVGELVQPLSNPDQPTPVVSSLRCLALVAEGADDAHLPLIVRQTFPALLVVVSGSQGFGAAARAGALQVVHACVSSLALMRGAQQREASDLLCSVLPAWLPHFLNILAHNTASESPEWGVRLETLKCLTQVVQNCGSVVEPKLPEILSSLWQSWVASIPAYEATVVSGNNQAGAGADADGVVNREQEDVEGAAKLEAVAVQSFELILSLVQSPRSQEHMRPAMEAVVYFSIAFMQISHEQEASWLQDPNQFVSDEEEDVISCRSSGCLLIEELVQSLEDAALQPISVAVQRRLVDSSTSRSQGHPLWWKLREAALLAVGCVADKFIGSEMSGHKVFDSEAFLDMLLNHDLGPGGAGDLPLLFSRCLWASGRFCPTAGRERMSTILKYAIDSMEPSKPAVIHVGACRALSRVIPNSPQDLLQQCIPQVYEGISRLLPSATDDVLHLILELLETVVRAGKHATSAVEAGVTPAVLRIWAENVTDPVISCDATDVLEAIADSPDCFAPLVAKAVPFLRSILDAAEQREGADDDGKVAGALEILTMILKRCSPQDTLKTVFDSMFVPLVNIMMTSSDHAELQNGAEAMAAFVRSGGETLLTWSQQPEATMKVLLDIAARLLSTELDASASVFVGPYLEQLLCWFSGYIGPHIQSLVCAIIARMSTNSLPTLTISLLHVFSRLVHVCDAQQRSQLVAFLATQQLPGTEGTALAVLAKEWCHFQGEIQGRRRWNMAVSALALLLATQDASLDSISVEACTLAPMAYGVTGSSSRVRARPSQQNTVWVPFPMKCFTFFAETLLEAEEDRAQHRAFRQAAQEKGRGEEDEDEEDEEEDEDEDSDSDDERDAEDDPLLQADFLQILQDYVLGLQEGSKAQISSYQDLFSEKQQQVLHHYFGLPSHQKT